MKITDNLVLCHIVGMNPEIKNKFINKFEPIKQIVIIDLDFISDKILNSRKIKDLYNDYERIKHKKNKKSKESEQELTRLWVDQMKDKLEENIIQYEDKEIIIIGQNHHHKYSGKRIKIPTENNYIIKNNTCLDVESVIRFNLDTYKNQIIKGIFPVKYIDFKFLKQKKEKFSTIYIKRKYEEIGIKELYKSLNIYVTKVL